MTPTPCMLCEYAVFDRQTTTGRSMTIERCRLVLRLWMFVAFIYGGSVAAVGSVMGYALWHERNLPPLETFTWQDGGASALGAPTSGQGCQATPPGEPEGQGRHRVLDEDPDRTGGGQRCLSVANTRSGL